MTEVAADWYDDPENPNLYRYWDGSAWTEHRAPKHAPTSPGGSDDNPVMAGFSLCGSHWKGLVVIGLIGLVVFAIGGGIIAAGVAGALEPSIWQILDRVADPTFNPEINAADQAFIESIRFDISTTVVVSVIVGVLILIFGQVIVLGTAAVYLARAKARSESSLRDAFALALSRLPRWVGVYLLWILGLAVIGGAVAVVAILIGEASVLLVLLAIPALIYTFPFLWLAPQVLLIGRRDEPPFRTTIRKIKSQGWGKVAVPVLLINLTVFGLNIATGIASALPGVGFLFSIASPAAVGILTTAMAIQLWDSIGGAFGEDITGDRSGPSSPPDDKVIV